MPREKSPAHMGDASSKLTQPAPALCPKIVTRVGSPPKAVSEIKDICIGK